MKKLLMIVLAAVVCLVLLGFTLSSMVKVFRYDLTAPPEISDQSSGYRLVLITQEMDTPFWNEVEKGASAAARQYGAQLAVWGSYGANQDDIIKNMEVAIASKVDGIIVQGLDTDEFNKLSTVKAAGNGIPVFTIANDVPIAKSLRRTYVGSDHVKAGQMIGHELIKDMGVMGNVVLMVSDRQEDFQSKRLEGILSVLHDYPGIRPIIVATGKTREKAVAKINDVMNEEPNVSAFIAVTADNAGTMVQEISKRAKLSNFRIYSFDDSSEVKTLFREKKMNTIIEQSPEKMGELSVQLMIKWLKREAFPLDYDGYYTDIRLLKADDNP